MAHSMAIFDPLLRDNEGLPQTFYPREMLSGCGEIGRRARLRIWCRKACGFESLHPHQASRAPRGSELVVIHPLNLCFEYHC